MKNVSSYSYDDFCVLEVELNSTVPDADVEQCWDMLRRKVGDAASFLPSGVSVSVQDDFGLVYGMFYAITGDGFSDKELDDYAEFLKREIGNIDGVARVNLYGKKTECINVSLTVEKMAALGVSPAEILSTLNGQNETTYSGYYDNGDRRVKVTVGDKFRTPEQIGELIIQGHEDDQLRLKDIATVESGYETPQRNSMEYDGERAVGMVIAAGSGTDIVKVGKQVEKRLEQFGAERLPVGIECHKVFFQPDEVTSSLTTFAINLIESVLIVIAILMLTMGFRSGLMIGISLVVIVIVSFLFLGAMDGTMQRVSLASFIFAMGMLVDNAIVITDGILVGLKTGKPRREAMTEENMLKMRNGTLAKGDLIESMLGTKPVKQVSDGIDIEWETPVVPRYNGQRSQKVMCSPAPGIETENARKALEAKVDQINLPEGYSVLWQGEKGASDQTMKYLFANVPIAIILIIAILILLFGDYRKPLIILCCIPLLGVGIVGAMLISGKTFTFCAIVGALGLVGMMMKNCIVLMDEINDQIASGKDPAEALISSSETRLRAVMMASMTTILGMIPLISDAMFGSMAVTIMGGLLFSTIATLFFVPLLYAVFFKIKMK